MNIGEKAWGGIQKAVDESIKAGDINMGEFLNIVEDEVVGNEKQTKGQYKRKLVQNQMKTKKQRKEKVLFVSPENKLTTKTYCENGKMRVRLDFELLN